MRQKSSLQKWPLRVAMALALGLGACASPRYQGPVSDHFDGTRFHSPYGLPPKSFWNLLKWQFTSSRVPWPEWVENIAKPDLATEVGEGEIVLTFVNHATFLIQLPGVNILTDPQWSLRASPVSFAGPKRVRAPGLAFEQLPKIDFVLISHNHYDHLDLPTVERLVAEHDPLFLVPLGDGRLLEKISRARFREMDWGQKHEDPRANLFFLPAQHWSARGLTDRNLSLWGSFLIETKQGKIYFGGDTGYAPHFAEIGRRFEGVDLSLLPVGAYEPRWFMKDQHTNPEEAVQAHLDLRSRRSLGMHFGTFQLTDEGMDEPLKALALAREAKGLSPEDFDVLKEGETRRLALRPEKK